MDIFTIRIDSLSSGKQAYGSMHSKGVDDYQHLCKFKI